MKRRSLALWRLARATRLAATPSWSAVLLTEGGVPEAIITRRTVPPPPIVHRSHGKGRAVVYALVGPALIYRRVPHGPA